MAETETRYEYITKVPVVGTFLNVFEARAVGAKGKAKGTPKFSGNFSFDPNSEDAKALKALAIKVARDKWPGVDLQSLQFPFTAGDKLAEKAKAKGKDREFDRGKLVLTARSQFRPQLSAVVGGKVVDYNEQNLALAKGKFYSGEEVLVQVTLKAYERDEEGAKNGVNAYLDMVVSTGKGTKVAGGGKSAAEVFGGYLGSMSTVDPTAGDEDEDEIPF